MNNGFLSRRTREGSGEGFRKGELWSFNKYSVKADNCKHFAFLSDVIMFRNLHFTGTPKMQICESDFVDENGKSIPCTLCKEPSVKFPDQNNYPTEHLLALVCVFEDKDQIRISKKGKEYPVDWIHVLTLPTNKKGIYTCKVEEASNEGYLLDDIWQIKKNKDNEILTPAPLDARELKKLGQQFDPEMHRDLQREYMNKPQSEILSLILSSLTGVKYDNHELIKMGIKPVDTREPASVSSDLDEE